MAMKCKQPWA